MNGIVELVDHYTIQKEVLVLPFLDPLLVDPLGGNDLVQYHHEHDVRPLWEDRDVRNGPLLVCDGMEEIEIEIENGNGDDDAPASGAGHS